MFARPASAPSTPACDPSTPDAAFAWYDYERALLHLGVRARLGACTMTLLCLVRHANAEGCAWPSWRTLAREQGFSEEHGWRTIARHIRKLTDAGALRVEKHPVHHGGEGNLYRFVPLTILLQALDLPPSDLPQRGRPPVPPAAAAAVPVAVSPPPARGTPGQTASQTIQGNSDTRGVGGPAPGVQRLMDDAAARLCVDLSSPVSAVLRQRWQNGFTRLLSGVSEADALEAQAWVLSGERLLWWQTKARREYTPGDLMAAWHLWLRQRERRLQPEPAAAESAALSGDAVWDGMLRSLAEYLPPAAFRRWVLPSRVLRHDGGSVVIGVPDNDCKLWLDHQCRPAIAREMARLGPACTRLVVEVCA